MARNKKRQTREFFEAHPNCIFCGGIRPASTKDHVPSRQMFYMKHWPEGFEFPSCVSCNSATKDEEQVVAMLARIYTDSQTSSEIKETRQIISAVSRNYPGILKEMRLSARETRTFLKERGIEKPAEVPTSKVPLLSFSGPRVSHCLEVFARKLFTALHCKHSGKIIPPDGGIVWSRYSNLQASDGELPMEIISLLGGNPTLVRSNLNLKDQFDYMYRVADEGTIGVYFVFFRVSFALFAYVSLNDSNFPEDVDEEEILRPLNST